MVPIPIPLDLKFGLTLDSRRAIDTKLKHFFGGWKKLDRQRAKTGLPPVSEETMEKVWDGCLKDERGTRLTMKRPWYGGAEIIYDTTVIK